MKLKKGSAEAKRYMASLRAKKHAPKKKAVKKAPTKKMASHKDTKSHNVNISVVSGDKNINWMILHDIKIFENKRKEAEEKEIFFTNHAKKFNKNTIEHKLNLKYAKEYKKLVKYYTIQINKSKKLIS